MQMTIVNQLPQRMSNVPRRLASETCVVVSVGKVQFVENVETEATLVVRRSLPPICFGWLESIAFLSLDKLDELETPQCVEINIGL